MTNFTYQISQEIINEKMAQLQKRIRYHFENVQLLMQAMYAKRVKTDLASKNHREYANEQLAIVGDAVLGAVISDLLYTKGAKSKADLSKRKAKLVNNNLLYDFLEQYKLIDFAFNDDHFYDDVYIPLDEQVGHNRHDAYIEAIVGAIYYDGGYDKAQHWIQTYLLPRLHRTIKHNNGPLIIYKK